VAFITGGGCVDAGHITVDAGGGGHVAIDVGHGCGCGRVDSDGGGHVTIDIGGGCIIVDAGCGVVVVAMSSMLVVVVEFIFSKINQASCYSLSTSMMDYLC